MCGRYSVVISEEKLRQQFGPSLQLPAAGLPTNYNVAPTQTGPVISHQMPDRVSLFRWGLVPSWAKDAKIGSRMINARSEGIADKPSFRKPIRERRCLVLADSFYEWQRAGTAKVPHRILPADGSLLVMAGIWDNWRDPADPQADWMQTYAIITGGPNADMHSLHDRMPMLLLDETTQSAWLDPDLPLDEVLALLHTPAAGTLTAYPVSTQVNSVRNNGPNLHAPVAA